MQSVGALTDLSSRGEGRGETAMQGIEHKIEMVVPNNNCDSNCSYYQCNITMWMDVHFAQHSHKSCHDDIPPKGLDANGLACSR